MTNRTKWTEYTGSDEQIAELKSAKNGFILRYREGEETEIIRRIGNSFIGDAIDSRRRMLSGDNIVEVLSRNNTTHFWLIPADPLREMKVRQVMTGQPVWTRRKIENEYFYWLPTTTPDWNIPNAEYSFTEFKEEA